MNALIYNSSMLTGLLSASVGAGMVFGVGVGLMVFGGGLVALTLLAIRLAH